MTDLVSVIKNILDSTDVQYKTLGELATEPMFKGAGITRKELSDTGIPCIRYADIYTTYGVWFDEPITFVVPEDESKVKYAQKGDIFFAITGEKVEEIAKSTAYVGDDPIAVGGDIVVLRHGQDPKYLSYVLSTSMAQKQKSFGKVKSKVVHSSIPDLSKIVVPIPSMDVQRAIVEVLDAFSSLLSNVETEESRRIDQLSVYMGKFIGYEYVQSLDPDSKVVKLFDIAKVTTGTRVTKSEIRDRTGYPVMSGGVTPMGYYPNFNREADTVTVVRYGSAGFVNWIDTKFWANDVCYTIDCSKSVIPRYMYYVLKASEQYLISIRTDAIPAHLQREDLESVQIVLPNIDVQKYIVEKLDSLSNLISNCRNEFINRLTQYEYYRDLILSFRGVKS